MTMGIENRMTKRYPYREPVSILSPQAASGSSLNIGAGGIEVLIPIELPLGSSVELNFLSDHAISLGTVCWTKAGEKGVHTGIQFMEEDWKVIELILARQQAKSSR